MNRVLFLRGMRAALLDITAPRLFESERGYQGALITALSKARKTLGIRTAEFLIEQEHQKRVSLHALSIRPDVIIHVPFDAVRHPDRREANFVVLELKVRAGAPTAQKEFLKLCGMLASLNYSLGVFVNIGSRETHIDQAPPEYRTQLAAFAVARERDRVVVTSSLPLRRPRAATAPGAIT